MELQTDRFLDGEDCGTVMAVVANLYAEVLDLQERVSALERQQQAGAADDGGTAAQQRADQLVQRVFSPFKAEPELP